MASTTGRIFSILKQRRDEVVSGEIVSAALGISRVAVWKQVKKLQTMGCRIQAGPGGYRLLAETDHPFPWAFPQREDRIHYFSTLPSTMEKARDMARKGCDAYSVVLAEAQTSGRGRLERTWQSPAGGLYFTMVLRPPVPLLLSARVTFAAALVLAQTLRAVFNIDARLKWPNDVLVNDRKLSGMLSELEAESDRVRFINIGIGINVNNDPPAEVPAATSIRALTGKNASRRAFLAAYLDALENRLENGGLKNVMQDWKSLTVTLGRPVTIRTTRRTIRGKAVDVDDNGALILQKKDGSREKIVYGDCFHDLPGER